MRIAFAYDLVYPYSKGGVEKRIWRLSHLLVEQGHEVHVLGMRYWDGPRVVQDDGVRLHGVSDLVPIYGPDGRRSVTQALRFAWGVFRSIRRQEFDIVDVQNMAPLSCIAALIGAKFSKTNVLITWHEVWGTYWGEYRGWQGRAGRFTEWLLIKLAAHHAAVSPTTMHRLATSGVGQVSMSPNGVDLAEIQSAAIGSDPYEVLYVGRLVEHKGLTTLIDAIALLKDEGIVPTVAIVGEGPASRSLELQAALSNLSNVVFLGRLETDHEVYTLMRSARVFVLPSEREGFGLAALEACAAGAPVVTVSHPLNAVAEFVDRSHVGIVCDASAASLAAGIGRLMTDNKLRMAFSLSAKRTALEHDWSATARSLDVLYRSILKDNALPELLDAQSR